MVVEDGELVSEVGEVRDELNNENEKEKKPQTPIRILFPWIDK